MPTYQQTIDFLYSQTPLFQQIGAAAYKPGLDTVKALAAAFGDPQRRLKCIHVAGTNGKGSTAHSIASVLQAAGYRTGLFTSPHLIDFRERIRIDGQMIGEDEVVEFVDRFRRENLTRLHPSFFELTTVMAFDWFARQEVDYAVIEVGLGGRLDSTNIITPLLSVITNISFDHTAQLGNTLPEIASEKAGIIKEGIPVVIGEARGDVREVFLRKARSEKAPIFFAEDLVPARDPEITPAGIVSASTPFGPVSYCLTGLCQKKNLQTILTALDLLRQLGVKFPDDAVKEGLAGVTARTGLAGRWMKLSDSPLTICDTGHNTGGWEYLASQLDSHPGPLLVVLGFVNDKDISHILPMMPHRGQYFFTRASVPRALPAETLAAKAAEAGLQGTVCASVEEAVIRARQTVLENKKNLPAGEEPLVFIGGSTFVVADALRCEF